MNLQQKIAAVNALSRNPAADMMQARANPRGAIGANTAVVSRESVPRTWEGVLQLHRNERYKVMNPAEWRTIDANVQFLSDREWWREAMSRFEDEVLRESRPYANGGTIPARSIALEYATAREAAARDVKNAFVRDFFRGQTTLPPSVVANSTLGAYAESAGRQLGERHRNPLRYVQGPDGLRLASEAPTTLGRVDVGSIAPTWQNQVGMGGGTFAPSLIPRGTITIVEDDDGEVAADMPEVVITMQPDRSVTVPPCRIRRCDCAAHGLSMAQVWQSLLEQYLVGGR